MLICIKILKVKQTLTNNYTYNVFYGHNLGCMQKLAKEMLVQHCFKQQKQPKYLNQGEITHGISMG